MNVEPLLQHCFIWLPLIAWVTLPYLVPLVATLPIFLLQRGLELRHGDTLPVSVEDWLREQLEAKRLDLSIGIAPALVGHADAYWPGADYIGLSPQTATRRHPSRWAIGAHELGHALVARKHPVLRHVFPAMRGIGLTLDRIGVATLLANTLFGNPVLTFVGLGAIAGSTLTSACILVDEAMASRLADRLLADDPRLSSRERTTARSGLLLAWLSYALGFASRLALVASTPLVAGALAEGSLFEQPPLHWTAVLLASALTLSLGKRALRLTWRLVFPLQVRHEQELMQQSARERIGDAFGGLGVMLALAIFLRGPSGAVAEILFGLAAAPALLPVGRAIRAVVLTPIAFTLREFDRLGDRVVVLQGNLPVTPAPIHRARPVRGMLDTLQNKPPLGLRLVTCSQLVYVPAVVWFWGWWFSSTLLS